ncbi:hypothetical protein GQ600_9569 [Phytophthora cactorum]|nr:hypothetical protein GQ600_9569 [Phytophthora cactorum]
MLPSCCEDLREELLQNRDDFSAGFWEKYGHYAPLHIYNVDETRIWYDMHPKRIWALRGKSSKIRSSQKHSALLTAVLIIRADGEFFKMAQHFIL